MQEEALIRRAQRQDADAFEQLLLAHQKSVYNLCFRMLGNEQDALDLSQETFLRVWKSIGQYQFDAAFSTWLYRITTNLCIDFLRRKKRRQEQPLVLTDDEGAQQELSVPDPQPLPEEQLLQKDRRQAVAQAMQTLPPDYRAILELRVVRQLSYEQIGDILSLPAGTVKSRLSRARMALKNLLKAGNFFDSDSSNQAKQSDLEVRKP